MANSQKISPNGHEKNSLSIQKYRYVYNFIAWACWVESAELNIGCVSAQRLQRLTESGEQADLATNKDTPGALPGPGSYGEG
jgi:hypothetical protein